MTCATFLKGNNINESDAFVVDKIGSAIVVGYTHSPIFDITPSVFPYVASEGYSDALLSKLNTSDTGLIFSILFIIRGNASRKIMSSVRTDNAGNIFLLVITASGDFRNTSRIFQTVFDNNQVIFIAELNAICTTLIHSTYIGGENMDNVLALVID